MYSPPPKKNKLSLTKARSMIEKEYSRMLVLQKIIREDETHSTVDWNNVNKCISLPYKKNNSKSI